MNKKQTAVQWLIEQIELGKIVILDSNKTHIIKCIWEIKEQAEEMEKQQIIDAYNKVSMNTAEQYINETYKSNADEK